MEKEIKLFLAPMAEITTAAFRKTVRSFSPQAVLYSEMLSAAAIVSGGMYNEYLLKKNEDDDPFVYQILGGDPELMKRACIALQERGPLGIDINMGCSAPEIIKKFQGCRLLSDIKIAEKIVKSCRDVCKCLLSVKMRSGFEETDVDYIVDFALMLQDAGVDYITIHPRHGKLSFKRKADWGLIKEFKEKLSIPVIANGDILTPEDAISCLEETGSDGVMIGRAAIASPWIFYSIDMLLKRGFYDLTVDLFDIYKDVMESIADTLPENLHKSRAHRFSFYYFKNFVFSHELMNKIRVLDRIDLMINTLRDYLERNPHERVKSFKGGLYGIHEDLAGSRY
jgi:tRNA-dihydrouridine synthase B